MAGDNDSQAKILQDYNDGYIGAPTNTLAGMAGADERRRQEGQAGARFGSSPSPRASSPSEPYTPFAFVAAIERAIPRWLEYAFGAAGAIIGPSLASRHGMLLPPMAGDQPNWAGIAGWGVAGAIGFMAGFVALRLVLRLFDFGLKLAIVLGGAAAVGWVIFEVWVRGG